MYIDIYEKTCSITSLIIFINSIILSYNLNNLYYIIVSLSGLISFFTRLYRIKLQYYIMNHPLVYLDILFGISSYIVFFNFPLNVSIDYIIIFSFYLMILAAIMSWEIFNINFVIESFYFQLVGHLLISYSLIYYNFINSRFFPIF